VSDSESKTLLPQIALVELPDAAWQRTRRRDPSTQPHIPFGFAQGRSVFGRDDRGREASGLKPDVIELLA